MENLSNHDCRMKYGVEIEEFRKDLKEIVNQLHKLKGHQSITFLSRVETILLGVKLQK